jgi:hypothetical protein
MEYTDWSGLGHSSHSGHGGQFHLARIHQWIAVKSGTADTLNILSLFCRSQQILPVYFCQGAAFRMPKNACPVEPGDLCFPKGSFYTMNGRREV